jgi:hypothetical protein
MLLIEIGKNEEVIERVTAELAKARITEGAIVSIIGAVDECSVSTMPADDATRDVVRTYAQPLEMFGTGEVRAGAPHIHAVFGTANGTAVSGHLHSATVRSWFVRVFVLAASHNDPVVT